MRLPLGNHPGIVLVALLVAGLLAWGFWPQPVMVEAVAAARAPLTVTIEEEGRTRVIDRYAIAAPVDGVICRVELDVGDPVTAGQVLLAITPLASSVLDPRHLAEAQARAAAARAALESARERAVAADATARYRAAELERQTPLAERGLIARDAHERAEMEARTAAAGLRAAREAVEVARHELDAAEAAIAYAGAPASGNDAERVLVRSPIDGQVLKVGRECEGPVRTGDLLLEVGDPGRLEVVVDLLSADAVRVGPGTRVRFDRWGGERPLEGVVRRVEPVGFTKVSALGVEEQRVLVIADFSSPPGLWQRLGDGYRVEAQFELWHGDDVLQVPAGSLFRHRDGWALFAVEEGRAVRRTVEVGQRNGLAAQILAGVVEGEPVIDHPSDAVEQGRRVEVR